MLSQHPTLGEYFPGKIAAVHGDGTYDIDYDDGDAEDGVKEDMIRKASADSNADANANGGGGGGKFKVGDSVEALYNGGDEWYGGKITADNGDGTFAIEYNDGDKEVCAMKVGIFVHLSIFVHF